MQLRISLGLILLATTTSLVGAAPARPQTAIAIAKRDVKCASADKTGAAFTSSSTAEESGNLFAVCSYGSSSSDCTYFTDGSFSSGGSSCPKGLVQDGSFAAGQGTSGGSSSGNTQQQQQPSQQEEKPAQQPQQPSQQQQQQQTQQQTSGSIDPSIECAAKDDDGTPLIASNPTKDQAGNDFAECTYQGAGACTYFFADGSFSSGSSQCPQGQAQDGNGGGQQQQTPPQTSTPPPPPPPQTTSTPPPPPPPTTSAPPSPPPTTTPPPPPPPPPPPSTPSATSTQVSFTTVVVPPPSEESGTSNNVPGQQGGLGAGVQLRPGMGMVLAVLPVVWVLFGL